MKLSDLERTFHTWRGISAVAELLVRFKTQATNGAYSNNYTNYAICRLRLAALAVQHGVGNIDHTEI